MCIQSYSSPYFPTFVLNTEREGVTPNSVQMRESTDQIDFEFGHNHAVIIS